MEDMKDKEKINAAMRFLTESYKEKYGDDPDQPAQMLIRISAKRVAKGAGFKWVGDEFKTLQFI